MAAVTAARVTGDGRIDLHSSRRHLVIPRKSHSITMSSNIRPVAEGSSVGRSMRG